MCYYIKRNIYSFLNKWWISLVFVVTSIIVSIYFANINNDMLFINLITTGTSQVSNFIYDIYKLIYIGYLLYVCYYVYMYDVKNNPEFIFLRYTNKKIVNLKYISLVLINVFIHIITLMVCSLFIGKISIHMITSVIKAFVLHFLIQSIFLVLIRYIGQYSVFVSLSIYYAISVFISDTKLELLIEIFIIILSYLINKTEILNLIERKR